jgi:hypothetical protein
LDEIVKEMIRRTNKEVSMPTLWRSLKFCGITRKKVFVINIFLLLSFMLIFFFFKKKNLVRKSSQREE